MMIFGRSRDRLPCQIEPAAGIRLRQRVVDGDSLPDLLMFTGAPALRMYVAYGDSGGSVRLDPIGVDGIDPIDEDGIVVRDVNGDGRNDIVYMDGGTGDGIGTCSSVWGTGLFLLKPVFGPFPPKVRSIFALRQPRLVTQLLRRRAQSPTEAYPDRPRGGVRTMTPLRTVSVLS